MSGSGAKSLSEKLVVELSTSGNRSTTGNQFGWFTNFAALPMHSALSSQSSARSFNFRSFILQCLGSPDSLFLTLAVH